MLFLTPMELWKYVQNDNLDTVFALGGAAVAATLHNFRKGYLKEYEASAALWRGSYLGISQLIITMQGELARKDWLMSFQPTLMAEGQAGLPLSTTNTSH